MALPSWPPSTPIWSWPRSRNSARASWLRESGNRPSTCRICRRCINSSGLPAAATNASRNCRPRWRRPTHWRANNTTLRSTRCAQDLHGLAQAAPTSTQARTLTTPEQPRPEQRQYQALLRNETHPDHLVAAQAQTAIAQTKKRNARRRTVAQAQTPSWKPNTTVRQRPGSNLPMNFSAFCADLAGPPDLAEAALPLCRRAGEVPPGRSSVVRGAIERAHWAATALRILGRRRPCALRCTANQRNNWLHVRLLGSAAMPRPASATSCPMPALRAKLNSNPPCLPQTVNTLQQLCTFNLTATVCLIRRWSAHRTP